MRAKLVNEAIKHLTPRPVEETGRPYYNYVEEACNIVKKIYKRLQLAVYWYNLSTYPDGFDVNSDEYYTLIDFVYRELRDELELYAKSKPVEEFAEKIAYALKTYGEETPLTVYDTNESIKYLKPKSDEEVKNYFNGLTPDEKFDTGVKDGLIWLVQEALAEGANVHAGNDYALNLATYKRDYKLVQILLDAGIDVHTGDDFPLRYASRNGYVEIVKILLDAGANVHPGDDYALQWASSNGHAEVVKLLVDAGANVRKKNLRLAVKKGYVEIASILKKAMDVNESIKHLTPFSKEQLKDAGYDEKYINWEPDGSMPLSNWGGIEIKVLYDEEAVEYRFNYGGDEFKPVIEAEIEWGIDEDDIDPDKDESEQFEPYFMVGEDKYFLKDFMRIDR